MCIDVENEDRYQPGQATTPYQESSVRGGRSSLHKAPKGEMCKPYPGSSAAPVQIDLATEPQRRSEMVAASDGVSSLPQLHLNNKYLGDWDTLQELEDFGELDAALQAAQN